MMTKHDIASLASKIVGIYAWLQSLFYFGMFSAIFFPPGMTGRFWINFLVPAALFALAGAYLFFRSDRVARMMFPVPAGETIGPVEARLADVQIIAFSIVGLALFVSTVGPGAQYLMSILLSSPFTEGGRPLKDFLLPQWPQIVSILVRLILGFALFIRPQVVAAWWSRKQPARI